MKVNHRMTLDQSIIIKQTTQWIRGFVIKLNLCPFAQHEMDKNNVRIEISLATTLEQAVEHLTAEFTHLDTTPTTETSLLVFPLILQDFLAYLDFVFLAESALFVQGYESIYQLATFHPNYCFANTPIDDVTNYTNRAPYPMLHILREHRVEQAIAFYGDTQQIPTNNITCLRQLGLTSVKKLLLSTITSSNN